MATLASALLLSAWLSFRGAGYFALIERTTVARLREAYGLTRGSQNDAIEGDAPDTLEAAGERPDEQWRTVAWVFLVVLVVEMFVANRTYAS